MVIEESVMVADESNNVDADADADTDAGTGCA